MKICVLTDAPCILNGGFSQRVLREMDLISSNYICEVYYYTFFSLKKYKELKKTPSLSNERNIKSAVRKVMDSYSIKEIETHFITSSRLRRILPDGLYDKFYANKVLKYVKKKHIDVFLCMFFKHITNGLFGKASAAIVYKKVPALFNRRQILLMVFTKY